MFGVVCGGTRCVKRIEYYLFSSDPNSKNNGIQIFLDLKMLKKDLIRMGNRESRSLAGTWQSGNHFSGRDQNLNGIGKLSHLINETPNVTHL
jgi:hypothetical protein